MKYTICTLLVFFTTTMFAQNTNKPIAQKLIVKTNLLNLLAQGPGITVEKPLSSTFSWELSYVQASSVIFYLPIIMLTKAFYSGPKNTLANWTTAMLAPTWELMQEIYKEPL